MKTITLSDEAYLRLKEWKQSSGESFSKVVLKVVPKRGTLGQMLLDAESLPSLSKQHAKVMEEAAGWGRDPSTQKDPWNS